MKDMRPDRDPRRLTDLLRSAVPASPDPSGRAADVVQRARRSTRRRGAVGAVAVAVAVGAVVVTPHFIGGSAVSNGATSPSATARLAHPFTCPGADRTPPPLSTPATDEVPSGAVLARLCPLNGPTLARWIAPVEALTTNVQAVADTYNSLPKGLALPCPAPTGPTTGFTITFQYPDGRLVQAGAGTDGIGGCDLVSLTGRRDLGRAGSGLVLQAFSRQLLAQRSTTTPATLRHPEPLLCPARTQFVVSLVQDPNHLDLTNAVLCDYGSPTSQQYYGNTLPLVGNLLRLVNRDYADHHTRDPSSAPGLVCLNPNPPPVAIYGETRWGDRVLLWQECADWSRTLPIGPQRVYWVTSQADRAGLAQALDRMRNGVSASPGQH